MLFLQRTAYRSMEVLASAKKTPGTDDGRLSLIDFEVLFFSLYIVYRMWTANIPSHSVKCSRLSESAVNRKEKYDDLSLTGWGTFLYFLTAYVALPLRSFGRRCTSTNSRKQQQSSMLDRYVTCFPKLRYVQINSKCNTYLCSFARILYSPTQSR
jgi:hypothetical protein